MTLKKFIKQFDNENSVVLLEGKRNVKHEDMVKLKLLGNLLTKHTSKMIFRSGNAEGADQLFSEGVAEIDKSRLQVIIPYAGHRSNFNLSGETISLDEIELVSEPKVVNQTANNSGMKSLVDSYVSGVKNGLTLKVSYLIRDTIKVIGTQKVIPASYGIFYDDLERPGTGGTGYTMNICKQNKIPFINQSVWFKWLQP